MNRSKNSPSSLATLKSFDKISDLCELVAAEDEGGLRSLCTVLK